MGLDVIAYSKLRSTEDYSEIHEPAVRLCPNPDFLEQADGYREEVYFFADRLEFKAGDYAGYREWLDTLSMMAHGVVARAAPKVGAFAEFINFSRDSSGVIGPRTSAKLLRDFKEHGELAKAYAADIREQADGEWFLDCYKQWLEAFELAADGGAVVFT